MKHPDSFSARSTLSVGDVVHTIFRLGALRERSRGNIDRLPFSLKILLENLLRGEDGAFVKASDVEALAHWDVTARSEREIAFRTSRVLLQDFTGVPCVVDLAAMRDAIAGLGGDPNLINPLQQVDLVIDHSVQVDHYGNSNALDLNMRLEFKRNEERYQFMKWGMQAFDTFKVVPPGIGIVHQVNLEYLARGVHQSRDGVYYPDTLVGTDSHTTMINGIGVVGWGVGGIEAEAGMLGQPVYMLTPDVVGVHLKGRLRAGVTATDAVLTVTEMLREAKVVSKFIEFFGAGTESLSLPDRATIANMAPEYGATMGFFPVDAKTMEYMRFTGRTDEEVAALEAYMKAQGLFGIPKKGAIDYSETLELDLATVAPSLAGPKRPQDRIELGRVKAKFAELFAKPVTENGYGKNPAELARRVETWLAAQGPASGGGTTNAASLRAGAPADVVEMVDNRPTPHVIRSSSRDGKVKLGHGDVLIAAITSCTKTSNPGVLIAAGLLAKKAVERGLTVQKHVKTSLAPGSRVVTDYLKKAGLLPYLEKLGFYLAGYGCTTCIGNSGPLAQPIEEAIVKHDLICAAVLSGNRNFEARIHANIKANFLASPPLVVAYAIAGTMLRDLMSEPLGKGKDGKDVWIGDVWPTPDEVIGCLKHATDPATFRRLYSEFGKDTPLWTAIKAPAGQIYSWPASTYIAEPPFFKDFAMQPAEVAGIAGARILGIFGDSVTTDHISPAGAIKPTSPAGIYLQEHDVAVANFNSYGARRGNHEVMMRGTFANVRIKNLMLPGTEGGVTLYKGEKMPIHDAAMRYIAEGTPTVVFGGEEYGTGSSRDWAAKGTQLLGVRAVIARSFERIHRSNLVGMGVLPLQFTGADSVASLGLEGDEEIDILGMDDIRPQQALTLVIKSKGGAKREVQVRSRIDTPIEVDYYRHGGILPYVLRGLISGASAGARSAA